MLVAGLFFTFASGMRLVTRHRDLSNYSPACQARLRDIRPSDSNVSQFVMAPNTFPYICTLVACSGHGGLGRSRLWKIELRPGDLGCALLYPSLRARIEWSVRRHRRTGIRPVPRWSRLLAGRLRKWQHLSTPHCKSRVNLRQTFSNHNFYRRTTRTTHHYMTIHLSTISSSSKNDQVCFPRLLLPLILIFPLRIGEINPRIPDNSKWQLPTSGRPDMASKIAHSALLYPTNLFLDFWFLSIFGGNI